MSSREEIIIDPVDGLRQRLALMLEEQQRRQISNGRYFTDGSKARDDRAIGELRRQIREMEAA